MASVEPFNRLVKLAARAFYDNVSMMGDKQPKNFRGDNRGIGVVALDALTRRQWVREEDLAKALKLHSKQLRRILHLFEEEKLVTREYRKEAAKEAKAHKVAAAAASDGQLVTKEGEEKPKMHTYSYCCLDYAQICDVVRYRIHHMKKKLKDELNSRDTIQHYICHSCNKRYSAFDALQLVSYTDDFFHCESCNGELVAVNDKLASEEMGDGDDNARKCRSAQLKDMQQRIDFNIVPADNVDGGDGSGKNDTGPKLMPPWIAKDEYIKAYYEAWRKQDEEDAKRRMQNEGAKFTCQSQSERQMGMKYKRVNEDEGFEGEEDLAAGEANKLEPQESGDDADDGFEWVEG